MNNQISIDRRYLKGLRFAVAFGSIFAWCLSIWWSSDGFNISTDRYQWLGVGLGLFVTVAQLLFNRAPKNPTIWIVGLFAYLYGFGTNISGIKLYLGLDISQELWKLDMGKALINSLIIYGLGAVVEIAPESFILWAINPESNTLGDFVTSVLGGSGYTKKRSNGRQNSSSSGRIGSFSEQNRTQNVPKPNNRTGSGQNGTKPFPYKINWTNITRNTNIEKVLLAHREYWNQTGRECPNKTLVKNTGISKGQVSTIISKLKSNGFS